MKELSLDWHCLLAGVLLIYKREECYHDESNNENLSKALQSEDEGTLAKYICKNRTGDPGTKSWRRSQGK